MSTKDTPAPSARTTMKRGANRAAYDREVILGVLAAGLVAHVGVVTDDGPIVLPMAYGVRDGEILIHGSVANAMLRAGRSMDVCVTVTIVDGLVVARTPFHNSMNYRSVVIRGTATAVGDGDLLAALQVINDHAVPIWDTARPPSPTDLAKTLVLAVPLAEASAKIRVEDPIDEEQDLDGPHWAGVVPVESRWGAAVASADLAPGVGVPPLVEALAGRPVHG